VARKGSPSPWTLPILLVLLNISCNLWADLKCFLELRIIEILFYSHGGILFIFLGAIESFRRGAQSGAKWVPDVDLLYTKLQKKMFRGLSVCV
jgi:hypothetical protein